MSIGQRWVLGVAIAVTAGMLLFPPWLYVRGDRQITVGYGLVFSPPTVAGNTKANTISWGRLAVQLVACWVVAGGTFVLIGPDRKSD